MKPRRPTTTAAQPGRGRLTAEQQLAQQKKEKRGVKARKELQVDEARIRDEINGQFDSEMDAILQSQETDFGRTQIRLIARLSSNLDELRLSSSRQLSAGDAALRTVTSGVLSLCTALAEDGIVDVSVVEMIKGNRPAAEIAQAIAQLGTSVAARLRDNEKVARKAEREMAVMAEALRKSKEQACAAEALIAARYVSATTEYLDAAELYRAAGARFERRMADLEKQQRDAFDAVMRDSALPKYHLHRCRTDGGQVLTSLDDRPADEIIERFLTHKERALVAQAALLHEVQQKVQELTRQHVERLGDRLRRDRTNLPADVRGALHDGSVSTQELLQLLDYVSFEPRVSETISAYVRSRDSAESAGHASLAQAPHDVLTAAAVAAAAPTALSLLPPRAAKLVEQNQSLLDVTELVQPGFGRPLHHHAPRPPPRTNKTSSM